MCLQCFRCTLGFYPRIIFFKHLHLRPPFINRDNYVANYADDKYISQMFVLWILIRLSLKLQKETKKIFNWFSNNKLDLEFKKCL